MTREEIFNLAKSKTDDMRKSKTLTTHFRRFFNDNKDVDSFAQWIKKIIHCPVRQGVSLSFHDPNFSKQTLIDDTSAFFYTLDQMTNGKHNLFKKTTEQEKYLTYKPNARGSCGTNLTKDANGQEKIVKEITVSLDPLVNSRTGKMHELWHAIDEKNYNLSIEHYSNQFLGEIGTMVIDYMGGEFIKSLYPNDKQLCDHISYLQNESKYNDAVLKARDGYLDYLLGKILVGTPQEQNDSLKELANGFDTLWNMNDLTQKINKIDAFVKDPEHNHYDPMYECRYVPASAIVFELRKSKLSTNEKVDKIVELNEHLLSIDTLAQNGETNEWDIITTHFGIPKIEQIMDNFANTITSANTPKQPSQTPILP